MTLKPRRTKVRPMTNFKFDSKNNVFALCLNVVN